MPASTSPLDRKLMLPPFPPRICCSRRIVIRIFNACLTSACPPQSPLPRLISFRRANPFVLCKEELWEGWRGWEGKGTTTTDILLNWRPLSGHYRYWPYTKNLPPKERKEGDRWVGKDPTTMASEGPATLISALQWERAGSIANLMIWKARFSWDIYPPKVLIKLVELTIST